jgi:CIC family chloride channel protein
MPDSPAPFVIVGMMALFGGVAKAPIGVILMVAEMTNEFSMIIPAMLATTIAYLVSADVRIYRSQVENRAQSPAHRGEFVIPLVQLVTVGDAMRTDFVALKSGMTVDEAATEMQVKGRKGFPVVDGGRLVGMFTATDAVRAEREGLRTVREAMTTQLQVALSGDSIHAALRKMSEARVSRLPVVDKHDRQRIIGMIDTADIALALDRQLLRLPDGNAGESGMGLPLLNRE